MQGVLLFQRRLSVPGCAQLERRPVPLDRWAGFEDEDDDEYEDEMQNAKREAAVRMQGRDPGSAPLGG